MIILKNCQGQLRIVEEGVEYRVEDECERINPRSAYDVTVEEAAQLKIAIEKTYRFRFCSNCHHPEGVYEST